MGFYGDARMRRQRSVQQAGTLSQNFSVTRTAPAAMRAALLAALTLSLVAESSFAAAEQHQAGADGAASDPATGPAADVVDYVLAAIDGEPITARDLRRFMVERGQPLSDTADNSDPAVRQALREMVVQQVVEREAKSAGIQVTEDEIHAYIAEIRRQNGVDEGGFEAILRSRGMKLESYARQVTFDILRTRLLSNKVRTKIDILDRDVDAYLAEHPAAGAEATKHVLQAVVKAEGEDAPDIERLRRKAERLRQEVVDGAKLEEVSGEGFSDLGFVKTPDLRDEFQAAVERLKPGEISEPIAIGQTFYVLQVSDSGANPADDARRIEAKKALFEERFRAASDKFLNDELPKKYHVELKL